MKIQGIITNENSGTNSISSGGKVEVTNLYILKNKANTCCINVTITILTSLSLVRK